jgi:hypothetical protein
MAAVFFLFALWIFFMADTGRHSILFDLVKSIPHGDKICHGLLYGVMTLLTNMALGFRTFRLGKSNLHAGTLFVAIFAVTEDQPGFFGHSQMRLAGSGRGHRGHDCGNFVG